MRNRPVIPIVMLSGLVVSAAVAGDKYERPRLLMEPAALAKPRVAEDVIVLDARSQEAFAKGHLPGARRVDHDDWKTAFGDGTDAQAWSRRISDLGIAADRTVVVYDDASGKDAARIWWILRYWGVRDTRLLNGGWKAWAAGDHPVSVDDPPAAEAAQFRATPRRQRLATKAQIQRSLDDGSLQIVDARSRDEFCGIDVKENQRGGAIPGAMHLEWSDLLDPETDRFKPPAELRKLFDQAGIDLAKPVAAHCQSGGRASVMVFAMTLMGAQDPRNYYPGWSEWGNTEDVPIVVPE